MIGGAIRCSHFKLLRVSICMLILLPVLIANRAFTSEAVSSATQCEKGLPDGIDVNASCVPRISNIGKFLETCPASDPATATVLADFEIRRNNIPVKTIPCAQPVSELRLASYSDELMLLQALRVIYYMDRGRSGHLPWTKGTYYDWLKAKVQGFDINDKERAAASCCGEKDGKFFISMAPLKDDKNGNLTRELDREWKGLAGLVGLIAHERRHADGIGHVRCMVVGINQVNDNMDQSYDEKNLSSFGVHWWLVRAWLTGSINLGIGCLAKNKIEEIAEFHMRFCNSVRETRFCDSPPPALTRPELVGGKCEVR